MNIEEMKKKFESGDYILLFQRYDFNWKIMHRIDTHRFKNDVYDYKLIHKKHEHILDAYLKDNNTLINVWVETCPHGAYGKADWENEPSFIENYKESNCYEIAQENKPN